MDLSLIPALIESTKAATALAKGAFAAVVDQEAKAKLSDVQSALMEIREKLGDAQEERLALIHQLAELREKVRQFEGAKAALDKYELFQIEQGKFLYRSKSDGGSEPEHFVCPTCHSKGQLVVLQSFIREGQTTYLCSSCKFALHVGQRDPSPPERKPRQGHPRLFGG